MIYLDSSALMKLVRQEAETVALQDWLNSQEEQPVVTSELGRVEVLRAARRAGSKALTEARAVMGDVDLVPLDRGVQDLACDIGEAPSRTIDALHLASAVLVRDGLTSFVAYDDRLLAMLPGRPACPPRHHFDQNPPPPQNQPRHHRHDAVPQGDPATASSPTLRACPTRSCTEQTWPQDEAPTLRPALTTSE